MGSIERLVQADAIQRLVDRDPTLFSDDVDQRQPIMQRLGWTDLAEVAGPRLPLVENLAAAVIAEGATDVVLLGMGGSSLAALVMERVVGVAHGSPRLHVLDTTSPTAITGLMASLNRRGTYFFVSSKSGTTIEPMSLYSIFRRWMEEELERPEAGKHFIAITDPGTPLEKMRSRDVMRVALSAPPTVGGRFSALSVFGLAPAAMIGVDLKALVRSAHAMETACHSTVAEENPAVALAGFIADAAEGGRDKLTFAASARYRPFGLWVEQLVAESTGKRGIGIVPVIDLEPSVPTGFGADRAVVVLRESADPALIAFAGAARSEGHPVLELTIDDPLDIGAEFVRWKHAVALLGFLLGINPFDEPNVAEAKAATTAVLEGNAVVPPAVADLGGVWVSYGGALAEALPPADLESAVGALAVARRDGDYVALLAYMPEHAAALKALESTAERVSAALGSAVCVELGPRYLHSTGQLHKGGPDNGLFLMLTTREHANVAIPGADFSLAQLFRAQAEGDMTALGASGRRVMRLDLPGDDPEAMRRVAEALVSALR